MLSGILGASSEFSSILSKTDDVGTRSPLETIVNARLHIMNNVAIIAVVFVRKFPADLENIKLSCEIPIPSAPPSDFWNSINITKIAARMIFIIKSIFSTRTN